MPVVELLGTGKSRPAPARVSARPSERAGPEQFEVA
jgi:hypothetical protein